MNTVDISLDEVAASMAGQPDLIESLVSGVQLAHGDTRGSRAMACLLLACYNSLRFPFDVGELCCLEPDREDAFRILRLRALGYEPHTFFENGGSLFEKLARAWIPETS